MAKSVQHDKAMDERLVRENHHCFSGADAGHGPNLARRADKALLHLSFCLGWNPRGLRACCALQVRGGGFRCL